MDRMEKQESLLKGAETVSRIELPVIPRATPEELARRRILVERARRLWDEVGPIGIRTDELIREVREEAHGA